MANAPVDDNYVNAPSLIKGQLGFPPETQVTLGGYCGGARQRPHRADSASLEGSRLPRAGSASLEGQCPPRAGSALLEGQHPPRAGSASLEGSRLPRAGSASLEGSPPPRSRLPRPRTCSRTRVRAFNARTQQSRAITCLGITPRRCSANSLGETHPHHCGGLCNMASVSSVALCRPLPYG
jgi:hypothetical protein